MIKIKDAVARCVGMVVLLGPSLCFAANFEPTNNNYPWSSTLFDSPMEVHSTWGPGTYYVATGITPSGDVDYVLKSCGGNRPVRGVGINTLHADIDIEAYKMDGTYLGGSYSGGTISESIDVSGYGEDAVVLKIWGYNGAVDTGFWTTVSC
jgi:hypothetical protein